MTWLFAIAWIIFSLHLGSSAEVACKWANLCSRGLCTLSHTLRYCWRHTLIFKSTVHSLVTTYILLLHGHTVTSSKNATLLCTSRTMYAAMVYPSTQHLVLSASCYTHAHLTQGCLRPVIHSVHVAQGCLYYNRHLCTWPRAIYDMIHACAQGHSHIYWQKPWANTQVPWCTCIFQKFIRILTYFPSSLCHSLFSLSLFLSLSFHISLPPKHTHSGFKSILTIFLWSIKESIGLIANLYPKAGVIHPTESLKVDWLIFQANLYFSLICSQR